MSPRQKPDFVVPQIDCGVLEDLFVIKGMAELRRHHDPIDRSSLRFRAYSRPARFSQLAVIDNAIARLLHRWGFMDEDWVGNFCTAASELLTNVVQSGPKGPRGGARGRMEIYLHTFSGVRYDYVFAFVASPDGHAIPTERLRTRLRLHFGDHGRGTGIVKAMTDLFTIITGTDGVIIMKKARHGASPS